MGVCVCECVSITDSILLANEKYNENPMNFQFSRHIRTFMFVLSSMEHPVVLHP